MSKNRLIGTALLVWTVCFVPRVVLAGEHPDGTRFVPNVPGQFYALSELAEPLGFRIGTSPNPSLCKHYQGIVRVDGADGTPFFFVTRSGNIPAWYLGLTCDDSDGEIDNGSLIVFRMDSREKNGERLRSNRLKKGVHVDNTPPPVEDAASIYYTVVEEGLVFRDGFDPYPYPPRMYQHPGGMQLVGHMLALVAEHPRQPELKEGLINYESTPYESMVMFFDVSNPEEPVWKSSFSPQNQVGGAAGVVGVTPLPGGRYLMVITGGADNDTLTFYRSTLTDLSSPDLGWDLVRQIPGFTTRDTHQALNFIREGNIYGDLYLAGTRGTALPFTSDRDRIDLYRVECDTKDCEPGESVGVPVVYSGTRITPVPTTFGTSLANLAAASGFYVSPSGELILYATEHDNDGPSGSVKAGEWRHADVVRADSPTLLPTAAPGGPYQVDEGDSVLLTGSARHPVTRPWIQIFSDVNLSGLYPVVDYDDHDLEDYDDLSKIDFLPFTPDLDHSDIARSWSWFAPVGCSIVAMDFDGATRTLPGTGALAADFDLTQVLDDTGSEDMDRKVDAVDFDEDCDRYYATPVELRWDLDSNGTYETTGITPTFDAALLDGPSTISIPVEATHPFGGASGLDSTSVEVRNVAPVVAPLVVTDSGGNRVPSDAPFVLLGVPLHVGAGFSDPGLPDHQTAIVTWGDGSSDDDGTFTLFDEAFGDGQGEVAHTHRYSIPGTFEIAVYVTDDDGGSDDSSATLDVLTPEQAVVAVVDLLDDLIAGTSNADTRDLLEKTRTALAGNPGAMNGALAMLQKGNHAAAIAFLNQALRWLEIAGTAGADVTQLIALLEQIAASVSAP